VHVADGRYECAVCHAVLDVPEGVLPQVEIQATSGKPNVRVLRINGTEIHRCEVGA
jgi:hypothetical protein